MAKNHFRTLGLAPRALDKRSDEQIRKFVQVIGRGLLQLEHPDAGGDEARFKEIQEAIAELGKPEEFERAKKGFLSSPQTQAEKLEKELVIRKRQLRYLKSRFRSYLEHLAPDSSPSAFRPGEGTRFSMIDTVLVDMRYPSPARGEEFFELKISPLGEMTEVRKGAEKKLRRVPIGCIPKGRVSSTGGIKAVLLRCHPEHVAQPDLRFNRGRRSRLAVPSSAPKVTINYHRTPWSMADPVLSLLQPEFEQDAYLFSLLETEGELFLYFDGQIIQPRP
ncbi:MAG: hypothetical protein AAB519_03305 [Patescibacteria group bacterium]